MDPGAPFWVPSPALQRHLNAISTGDPGTDWLSHVRARHLPSRLPRVLILGAGNGFLERPLLRLGGVEEIVGADTDPVALDEARGRASRLGLPVRHVLVDARAHPLPEGPWDAILVHGFAHHAPDPGDLLERLRAGLADRGRLVLLDYIGPNRFVYETARRETLERYARLLPVRLRRDAFESPLSGEALARVLPHEAAHSAELPALARGILRQEALYPGGGGLLHPLLAGLQGRFGRDPMADERLLTVLCEAEARLTSQGSVPSDFAIFVGRRSAPVAG
jgi:SAM-dependent methyltransferase